MASITRRLLLQSRQCPSRIRVPSQTPQWQRPLSTTPTCRANEPTKEGSITAADAKAPSEILGEVSTASTQRPVNKALEWRSMSATEREEAMLDDLHQQLSELDPEVVRDAIRKGKRGIPFAQDFNLSQAEDFEIPQYDKNLVTKGFWAEGEPEMGPDEDYYADDVTSHGHGELRAHRDLREYARLIAWELPLLSQLARPFEQPTASTPFRFRYTSYLGESHPATNKVVVEFAPGDLSLTPQQVSKMIKLAGVRYNPSTTLIKLSCEDFDTQAQNKRFLGETISSLIAEAKDSKDTFEDVPFDFRHHKKKKFVEFPKEWVLTKERKEYLEGKRERMRVLEDEKLNNGEMVDGKKVIETSLPFVGVKEEVLVEAPRR